MIHCLCKSPSIPLSFSLAAVLPRRFSYRVSYATQRVDTPNSKRTSFRAWTTGVSNPIRYPRFRVSVSVMRQLTAFAFGVPHDINGFHPYTMSSINLSHTRAMPFRSPFPGWAGSFDERLTLPPTHPLRPIIPDNARGTRITAAAGTSLATPYS